MAKIKVQVVKEKKKGLIRKIIWGSIALIGFLASLVTVIDFMSNNKGYISRFIDGIKNIFSSEEPIKQEQPKKETSIQAEPEKPKEKSEETKQQEQNPADNNPVQKDKI